MKLLRSVLTTSTFSIMLFGCSAPTAPVDDLVIEPRSLILPSSGDSAFVRAVKRNARGENSDCAGTSWQSSDENVVVVNGRGKIKARGVGSALILATCGTLEASATVQVSADGSGSEIRAFPEAQGWGAGALQSCRSGGTEVLFVTSLDDDGPGSLRSAVAVSRDSKLSVIVFRVGGYIDLETDIEVRDRSCIYIAGQTAPGDGVTIRRAPGKAFYIKGRTHDIVFRHLRFRGGYAGNYRGHIGIMIGSGENYVLDHLSLGWTTDKALVIKKTATAWSHPVSRVTVQRSILAETFADHPTGMQISGEDNNGATDWKLIEKISVHHNLFAHNSHRNPNVTTLGTEVVNNVIYNWKQGAVQSTRGSRLDVVSNHFIPGPMTDPRYLFEATWNCENDEGFEPSLYVEGNIGPHNSDPASDNWSGPTRMTACYYSTGGTPGAELPAHFRRETRLAQPQWPIMLQSATAVRSDVLADVGAAFGLTCAGGWIRRSDAPDLRVLNDVATGSGPEQSPENESQAGGFPLLNAGTACPDRDGDGMPDEHEERVGLDPEDPVDALQDSDGDGYSNIEEYINASA